jgi:PAS domain S-box-containing protein
MRGLNLELVFMLIRIKQWLQPPNFPGDDEKNREAQLVNTLSLFFVFMLLVGALVFVPLFVERKGLVWAIIAVLAILYAIGRYLLLRGQVVWSHLLMVVGAWAVFQGVAIFSAGISGPMTVAIVAVVVIIALQRQTWIGYSIVLFSILCGLILAILNTNHVILPTLFTATPLAAWFFYTLGLGFVFATVNLVMRNLQGAMARDREQNEALKKTEAELREREARLKTVTENTPDTILQVDREGRIIFANRLIPGLSLDEVIGSSIYRWVPAEQYPALASTFDAVFSTGQRGEYESLGPGPNGEPGIYSVRVMPVLIDGKTVTAIYAASDITDRVRAEEKIRAALEEKETLLHEVHHRVKNNLQVIIALINMQTHNTHDAATVQFLKELKGQAHTMSLVYEQLYQSEDLSRVSMAPYLRQLTANILEAFGRGGAIQLHLDASLSLDVTDAMPCGLILNELFTNTLKHAFPPGFTDQPSVSIILNQDGKTCHLTFSDNGVGLPPGADWRSSQTLGLRLVNLWATHQLGGTLEVASGPGTTFALTFDQAE